MGRRDVMNQEQLSHARRLMVESHFTYYFSEIFKISRTSLFDSLWRLKDDDFPPTHPTVRSTSVLVDWNL